MLTSFIVSPSQGDVYLKPDQLAWLIAFVGDEARISVSDVNQLTIELPRVRFKKVAAKLTALDFNITIPESVNVVH